MTQSQFMYKLMVELAELPDEKKYVIMNDYNRFFSENLEKGLSEEQITEKLQSPVIIAQSYKDGSPLSLTGIDSIYNGEKSKRTAASTFKFICLIPAAIILFPLITFLGLTLFLLSAGLCVVGVCIGVFSFTVASIQIGFIFMGVGGIFFTLCFLFLSIFILKVAFFILKSFTSFMKDILHNRKARHSV